MDNIETEQKEVHRNDINTYATSLQLRASGTLNKAAVEDYRLAYQEGRELPPLKVCVEKGKYYLFDGFHRHEASQGVFGTLPCIVYHCNRKTAQWLAIAENVSHGLRRSGADKRRAVEAALNHPRGKGLSDELIAQHAGVSDRFVAKVRKELFPEGDGSETRIGKDGREIKVSNIGKRSTPNGSESRVGTEPPKPNIKNELPEGINPPSELPETANDDAPTTKDDDEDLRPDEPSQEEIDAAIQELIDHGSIESASDVEDVPVERIFMAWNSSENAKGVIADARLTAMGVTNYPCGTDPVSLLSLITTGTIERHDIYNLTARVINSAGKQQEPEEQRRIINGHLSKMAIKELQESIERICDTYPQFKFDGTIPDTLTKIATEIRDQVDAMNAAMGEA